MNATTQTTATATKKIRFVLSGTYINASNRFNPAHTGLKAVLVGYTKKEIAAIYKNAHVLDRKDFTADFALVIAESMKALGLNVVVSKEAMAVAEVAKVFNAPRPGAQLGWVTRSSSNSTNYFITCATEAECMVEFKKLTASYHPCGYGTSLQASKAVACGHMIEVYRSNSCD